MGVPPFISIDIEPTNRCNADCYFCPRDQTPHEGLMSVETFDRALERAVEFRSYATDRLGREVRISLCGLGEPLLNKHAPTFVRQARDAGFECSMSTNAALLDERRATALLEAGLSRIDINVGEAGDDYEEIYKLPWEKTRDNVLRFNEMAGDDCEVQIILVNHRGDRGHLERMTQLWTDLGLENFFSFDLINRGGALFVDHMQFEQLPQRSAAADLLAAHEGVPLCAWAFVSMVVGYDGLYYLCCSDWKKEVPLGSVFDRTFVDVLDEKLDHVIQRDSVCRTCNLDPLNRLTDEIRARDAGRPDTLAEGWLAKELMRDSRSVRDTVEGLKPGSVDAATRRAAARPARIPVTGI